MPSTQLFDGDSSDSETETPKPKAPPKAADDEDSDQGEVDFDDGGAVVGLQSSTMTGRATAMKTRRDDDDDDNSSRSDDDDMMEEKKGDKRTLVVQEFKTRPDLEQTQLHMTKLPNLVGIQTEAFDESTYSAKQEQEDFGQAAYNLMRWRYGENGEMESNTRFVEWEDGSMTLHIGTETFNIDSLDSSNKKTKFPGMNGYLYLSSNNAQYKPNKETEGDDEAKEESAGTVLECLGAVQSRFVIKPSSLQSDAHKSLTLGIRQKTVKTAKIAEIVTQHDPEKLKAETAKLKSDMEKSKRSNYGGGGGKRRPKKSRDFIEDEYDDDDYNTVNLNSMKRKTMSGDYDDDDESDDDYGNIGQGKKQKGAAAPDSDSDEMVLDTQGDDDDAPVVSKRKQQQKSSAILDDDDSE